MPVQFLAPDETQGYAPDFQPGSVQYLAAPGMGQEQLNLGATPPPPSPSLGRSAGLLTRDVVSGASALPGMAYDLLYAYPRNAASAVSSAVGGPSFSTPYAGEKTATALDAFGLPRPQTGTEMVLSGTQQGLIGAMSGLGLGPLVRPYNLAVGDLLAAQPGRQAVSGALSGAASGGAAALGLDPSLQFAAGALAGLAPTAIPGTTSGFIEDADRALLNKARAPLSQGGHDIPIPDAMAGPSQMRFAYSTLKGLPGAGGAAADANTRGAYNAAIGRTFGEPNATSLTLGDGGVYDNAATRIGGYFQNAAANGSGPISNQQLIDLKTIRDNALALKESGGQDLANRIDTLVSQIQQNNGVLPGKWLVNELKVKSPTSIAARGGGQAQEYWSDLKGWLQDSLANAPGIDMNEYNMARQQWRNMMVAQSATDASGNIKPGVYTNAAVANAKRYAGADPTLLELGQIGSKFIREPPSSGTTERALSVGTMAKAAEAFAAAVGGGHAVTGVGDPVTAALVAAAPAAGIFAGGPLAARYMRWGQTGQVPDVSFPAYAARTAAVTPTQAPLGAPGITAPPPTGAEQMSPYWRALMGQ